MKAFYITTFGGSEVLQYGDLPKPCPNKKEVLIEVKAVSLNPMDWKMRTGYLKAIAGKKFPMVLGTDFSGVVCELGKGVTGFSVGDTVYGAVPMLSRKTGALAEFMTAPAKSLRRLPQTMTFEQAAALPVAGLTGLNGVNRCGEIKDKTVLINGATGGVGHYVTQIMKAGGATITAICSEKNADKAREFGAAEVLDYRKCDFTHCDKDFDVFFDVTGMLKFKAVAPTIKPNGSFVTTQPSFDSFVRAALKWKKNGKRTILGFMSNKVEDYAELERLVGNGQLKIHFDRVIPFSDTVEAFKILESGGVVGKIIISF
jgi:NADPH:quinone reductase-like Zn-dependent oxidoreductase